MAAHLQEGAIERGAVSRIEAYGAFVELENHPRTRGLVHISQIVNYRLERVEDALAVNDVVYVKVLEITREDQPDGRVRTKIRLSMKDAAQDGSRQDLGQEREAKEAVKDQIASNLNSTIGMGVALDPMANRGNLILKSDSTNKSQLINGYALVADDEGEPPAPVVPVVPVAPVVPMGRGRGTTLPAWMTRGDDGPRGGKKDKKKKKEQKRKDKEERKHRKHDRKRKRRKRDDSDTDESRNKGRKHRRRYDDSSDSDNSSLDRRRERKRKSRKDHGSDVEDGAMPFRNVGEARKLIAELERRGG